MEDETLKGRDDDRGRWFKEIQMGFLTFTANFLSSGWNNITWVHMSWFPFMKNTLRDKKSSIWIIMRRQSSAAADAGRRGAEKLTQRRVQRQSGIQMLTRADQSDGTVEEHFPRSVFMSEDEASIYTCWFNEDARAEPQRTEKHDSKFNVHLSLWEK